MKKLYIIRHAKSSWGDFSLPDFERPLNERGKKDAPVMAKRLLEKNVKIDAFVSSPAKRAKKTCKIFCKEYDYKEANIILIDKLYNSSVESFFEVAETLDNKFDHVAIFSHNPGVTDFANRLCKDVQVDEIPTCAVFAVEILSDDWRSFRTAEKKFLFFDFPKSV